MPPEILDKALPDPSSIPDWAVYLLLAGWLIDKVLAFIKWQMERASKTDSLSQSSTITGAAQEVHDMSVIVQARDNEGKPLVWSSKASIISSIEEVKDYVKELRQLSKANRAYLRSIARNTGVVEPKELDTEDL